jgi:hypothetical protein
MKRIILIALILSASVVTQAQTGLKYIKIGQVVYNRVGDTLKSGMAIIVNEIDIPVAQISGDSIPVMVVVIAYKDINAKLQGKYSYAPGEVFNSNMLIKMPKIEYTNSGFEGNLFNRVLARYNVLYPGQATLKTQP